MGADSAPAAVDWDSDGDADVVVGGGDGALSYLENDGGGTMTASANPLAGLVAAPGGARPAFGDTDGDGAVELVAKATLWVRSHGWRASKSVLGHGVRHRHHEGAWLAYSRSNEWHRRHEGAWM